MNKIIALDGTSEYRCRNCDATLEECWTMFETDHCICCELCEADTSLHYQPPVGKVMSDLPPARNTINITADLGTAHD